MGVEPAWQGDDLPDRLRVVAARLSRCLRTRAGQQLTPSQLSLLARIAQAGPLRLGALAEAEALSPAVVTRTVDALVGLGLVDRLPDPRDGRAVLVATSSRGGELLARMRVTGNAVLRDALEGLPEDRRALIADAVPALEDLVDLLQLTAPGVRAPEPVVRDGAAVRP